MKNKNEIRGFKAGTFLSSDHSAFIKIQRSDDCVQISLGDHDADIVYEFHISYDSNNLDEVPFTTMSISESRIDDLQKE